MGALATVPGLSHRGRYRQAGRLDSRFGCQQGRAIVQASGGHAPTCRSKAAREPRPAHHFIVRDVDDAQASHLRGAYDS